MSLGLVIIDTDCHVLAHEAVSITMKQMKFNDVLIYSDKPEYWNNLPVKKFEPLTKKGEYDNFVVNELHKDITTNHILMIQFDGFVIGGNQWSNLFLHYDYIGAPWPTHNHGKYNVGNGGFSLRSKRLCEEISNYGYNYFDDDTPEDIFICQKKREDLEQKRIYIPHESIASHFSAESFLYRYPTFGFHNIRFLPLVYKDRLDFLLDNLSDRVIRTFGGLMIPNLSSVSERHAEKLKAKITELKNGNTE